MVFTEILLKYPYRIAWNLKKRFHKERTIYFYVADELDYIVFRNVHRHLPEVKFVAKNKQIQSKLKEMGINSELYPVFPDVIIMARHSLHKFPCNDIVKIGMRHGAYHFKDFINSDKYNAFDLFLLTSPTEVEEAKEIGINSAISGGFPKVDDLFKKEIIEESKILKHKLFANAKPTILFTATWEKSGLSAIEQWYNKLDLLTEKYNIIVTVHPWTRIDFISHIKNTRGVHFIESADIALYLLMADLMIADTSSIIAEYNALCKPIITIKLPVKGRLTPNIVSMLEDISFRIENFQQIFEMIETALANPEKYLDAQQKYNKILFDDNLGNHSELSANIIRSHLNL